MMISSTTDIFCVCLRWMGDGRWTRRARGHRVKPFLTMCRREVAPLLDALIEHVDPQTSMTRNREKRGD